MNFCQTAIWKIINITERNCFIFSLLSCDPVGEAHWLMPPTWPGSLVTIRMNCFTNGGPGKEYGTNKPPPTGRVRERSKGDTVCPSTSQNPSR